MLLELYDQIATLSTEAMLSDDTWYEVGLRRRREEGGMGGEVQAKGWMEGASGLLDVPVDVSNMTSVFRGEDVKHIAPSEQWVSNKKSGQMPQTVHTARPSDGDTSEEDEAPPEAASALNVRPPVRTGMRPEPTRNPLLTGTNGLFSSDIKDRNAL